MFSSAHLQQLNSGGKILNTSCFKFYLFIYYHMLLESYLELFLTAERKILQGS